MATETIEVDGIEQDILFEAYPKNWTVKDIFLNHACSENFRFREMTYKIDGELFGIKLKEEFKDEKN